MKQRLLKLTYIIAMILALPFSVGAFFAWMFAIPALIIFVCEVIYWVKTGEVLFKKIMLN